MSLGAGGASGACTTIPGATSSGYSFTVSRTAGTCDIAVGAGGYNGSQPGVTDNASASSGVFPATPTVTYTFTRDLTNRGNHATAIGYGFNETGGGGCNGSYTTPTVPAAIAELVQNEVWLSSRQTDGGSLYSVPNGGIWWRRLRNIVQRARTARVGQLWPI